MTDRFLRHELAAVARRQRQHLALWGLGALWLVIALIAYAVTTRVGGLSPSSTWLMALPLTGLGLSLVWLAVAFGRVITPQTVARQVESRFPSLDSALLTVVDEPADFTSANSLLRDEVAELVRDHARRHPWRQVVTTGRLLVATLFNLISLGLLGASLLLLSNAPPAVASLPSSEDTDDERASVGEAIAMTVEPGDTEVERGTGLTVLARFDGAVPEEARLVYGSTDEAGEAASYAEPMRRSLRDPVLSARIEDIDEPAWYRVETAGAESPTYRIDVFEYPQLEQADARLVYPEYTNQSPRELEDIRRLTAIRGTTVTLTLRLNKPVASAVFAEVGGEEELACEVSPGEATASVSFELQRKRRFELKLTDERGRANKAPPGFRFVVLDNKRPVIKLKRPKGDVSVSPLEELDVAVEVSDDFPLQRVGMTYSLGGLTDQDVILSGPPEAGGEPTQTRKLNAAHVFRMENMDAVADDLLSYSVWAEDIGPDGAARRTSSDLYFAEIRPFEEIFRQGQPQEGQPPQGQAQQAEELLKLQKQILTATWNVSREAKQSSERPTEDDVSTIAASQKAAIEQLDAVIAELKDEQSIRFANDAREAMVSAAEAYDRAAPMRSLEILDDGGEDARRAYQSLLKLRAREHRISRSRSQGQSSRQQQQMDNLELDEDDPRYESQRQASEQETAAQQEDRQFLSRLRELARRQADLNERVKELQSALDEAETDDEREEIERRLKRLQEEQQQVIRDAEELAQRMSESADPQRNAESEQQLSQAQSQARQASEALEQGQVSRAAAEGERAEEAFEELKEEFQRRTAGAFANEMRELQDRVRQLAEREEKLAEGLEDTGEPAGRPSLRSQPSEPNEEVSEAFEQQRNELGELMERMREVVGDAEDAEQPVLAERLYDAVQDASRRSLDEALQRAESSYRRGLSDDAERYETIVAEGIESLRENIREAAESVFGDETEALRRARENLRKLQAELDSELQQKDPRGDQTEGERGADPNDRRDPSDRAAAESSEAEDRGDGAIQDPQGEGSAEEDQSRQNSGERGTTEPGQSGGQPQVDRSQQGMQGQGERGERESSSEGQPASGESGEQGGRSQQPADQPGQTGEQPGQGKGGQQQGDTGEPGQPRPGGPRSLAGGSSAGGGGANGGRVNGRGPVQDDGQRLSSAPLTGDDFVEWSDRLRDVEELLSDSQLRAEASSIRDRAREIRKNVRRHSEEPNWDIVRTMIAEPLSQLERKVEAELIRRTSEDMVPLDRQPVPPEFEARVREYYRRLGVGR